MINELIHKYCEGNEPLEQILLRHSTDVARRALKIAMRLPYIVTAQSLTSVTAFWEQRYSVPKDSPYTLVWQSVIREQDSRPQR